MTDITQVYAADITKAERDANGDLNVYGKATGPDLDLDLQRCDPGWLKRAMPEWMAWGNVREMHQPVVAGIGVELSEQDDSWFLKSRVIDSNVAAKMEAGAYKGYSIGIKDVKTVKSADAPKGMIVGGTIVEVSYVDRPCNPESTLSLVKMAGGNLTPVDAEGELATEVTEPEAPKFVLSDEDVARIGDYIAKALKPDDGQPVPPVTEPADPKTPAANEPQADQKALVADLVKAAVTEALSASEERYKALEADMAKVLATEIPGGPLPTVPPAMRVQREADNRKVESARLRKLASEIGEKDIAQSYRKRADELDALGS